MLRIGKKFYISILIAVIIIAGIFLDVLATIKQYDTELENENEAAKTENSTSTIPKFEHIVLIVMENRSYEEIVGNKNAPFVNQLIKTGGLAANYYAITHPSLPNYIALLGGSTFNIKKNCTHCFIKKTNLIDQLEKAHISWRAYFESLPSSCFLGSLYPYTRKYNSFVYFSDIIKNKKRCNNIVPYSQLSTDLKNPKGLPDFIWISPNLCSDTHYCPVETGDKWLSRSIPAILTSSLFKGQNSLLILTWDEAEKKSGKNHIAAIFIGSDVKKGYKSGKYYNHYSLLHTIETSWGIPPISERVAKTAVMSDFFY